MSCLSVRPLTAALLVTVFWAGFSASDAAEESVRRYVKNSQGERPEPVVAVDNVCAWPNLTVLAGGTLVATIFNQPSHGSLAGDVECWGSKDGGISWTKHGTPARHEPDTTRMNVAAGLANNGDLIVIASGWSNKYPPGKSGAAFRAGILDPWVCRSCDGGRTWTIDREAAPKRSPDGFSWIPFGDIVPGDDDVLRVAVYSWPGHGVRNERVFILQSRDDGKTWGDPVQLDEDATRNETALLNLGGNDWLAAARFSSLFVYASTDNGKTWQARGQITAPGQHPAHLMRMNDGRVLLSYGDRTGTIHGVQVLTSTDEGKTWSEPVRVMDWEGDGGYPSSVQLPDGRIVTAYYARKIEGHDRYHMGTVRWDPVKSFER